MDVRFPSAAPTDAERQALDALLGPAGASGDAWEREHGGVEHAATRRPLLLSGLHALQDRVGYITSGGLGELCRRLDVAPSEAYGVASFYALFSLEPGPARTVHVCDDLACGMAGGGALVGAGAEAAAGRTDVRVVPSPCLGMCERAPAVLVTEAGAPAREAVIGRATADDVAVAIRLGVAGVPPEAPVAAAVPPLRSTPERSGRRSAPNAQELDGGWGRTLLGRVGRVEPMSLDDYRRESGYAALRRAVEIGPAKVIDEVTTSRLVGRGGAAFPAGRKWAAVASQAVRTRYLVCNADESEPGTFKDRVLMEGDPFAIVEAMTIAAFATGCERGYVYLRGEYPRARHHLQAAIDSARRHGLLGDDVMGAGFRFDVEIVRGAGAYICGEETAIFNSIEGYRGEPRSKPPFPVEVGLFGKPTLVNNVETLANVLPILLHGGEAFASIGSGTSTGTKLFCVSGAVATPGVFEVPFGTTLRELIDLAGGSPADRPLQALLLGGAAGAFVRPDQFDVPLTFEGVREAKATLGSGVVMAIDAATPIEPFLRRIAAFFRDESCGQCVPCRVGTVRQEEALHRLTIGPRRPGDLALLREVGQVMKDASICGLGQTAWNAIESAIDQLGALR